MTGANNDILKKNWSSRPIQEYWGEMATGKHVVQVYDSEDLLLDALEGFARSGLNSGESVIFIARKKVLTAVKGRLEAFGFDTKLLTSDSRLILLEASEVLSGFMGNGMPDQTLFNANVKTVYDEARGNSNRTVRAYGEMVTLLWQDNNKEATISLEVLWNDFCTDNKLTLFCAYPIQIFDRVGEFASICKCHHHLLSGTDSLRLNVYYSAT